MEKKKEPHNFTHIWDKKTESNKQANKQTDRHRQRYGSHQRERGMEEIEEGKWYQMQGDGKRLDLGGKYTMQYVVTALQNCIPEAYILLLTTVTPIKLIK